MMNKIKIVALTTLALASIANISAQWNVTNALNKKVCVTLKVSNKEIRNAIAPGKHVEFESEKWMAKLPVSITVQNFKAKCPKGLKSIGTVEVSAIKKMNFDKLKKALAQNKNNKKYKEQLIKKFTKTSSVIRGKLHGHKEFILVQKDSKYYVVTAKKMATKGPITKKKVPKKTAPSKKKVSKK